MQKRGFKELIDLTCAIESYPLSKLIFPEAYETLVTQASMVMLHKWQDGIERAIKHMLTLQYGNTRQLESFSKPEQIDEKLSRFYRMIN